MPLYFFNQMDGHVSPDTEGSELSDLDAARDEAIVFLGQSIKDHPGLVRETGELRVEITGEDGSLLTTIVVHAIDPVAPEAISGHLQG